MIEQLQGWDEALMLWIHQGWRSPWGDTLFVWLTTARHFLVPLGLLWFLLLWRGGRRGRVLALVLVLTLLATDQVSSHLLKPWVDRVRPCFAMEAVQALKPQAHSPSFPSGHAANIFGAATAAVALLGWRWAWLYGIASAVGISRIYVGVHYPSDVLGGALLGVVIGWMWVRTARWTPLLPRGSGPRRARRLEPAEPG